MVCRAKNQISSININQLLNVFKSAQEIDFNAPKKKSKLEQESKFE